MHSKCTFTEQASSYLREFPRHKNKTVKQTEQNSLKDSKQYIFLKAFIKIADSVNYRWLWFLIIYGYVSSRLSYSFGNAYRKSKLQKSLLTLEK